MTRLMRKSIPSFLSFRRMADETGASMVEFAFVFVILSTMIFGIYAFGWALYAYNLVSESAREATRYASVRGSACINLSDCKVTQAQISDYVKTHYYPGINASNLTVTATWPCTPKTTPCNAPGNPVSVKVAYQFALLIPFVPARTLTLASSSQMVISQ